MGKSSQTGARCLKHTRHDAGHRGGSELICRQLVNDDIEFHVSGTFNSLEHFWRQQAMEKRLKQDSEEEERHGR